MLVDEVNLTISAGHGGPGKVSFFPGGKSGPDGGNGGKGGDVYVATTPDITALNQYSHKNFVEAENGLPGQTFCKTGKNGKNLILIFPIGTTLIDQDTWKEIELNALKQTILLCQGGKGGRGNHDLRSPKNTTPRYAQPGLAGQTKRLKIILKLIADYGLIGLPNAGKTSLLNELTSARAKVANYPFTTLEPNLGSLKGKIIADIPGLIEGASHGKGLGIKFLKHIEKVSLLLHCLSCESSQSLIDYQIIRKELEKFNPLLIKKPEIILLTKSDLLSKEALRKKHKILQKYGKVLPVSIHDWDSLQKLKKLLKTS